MIDKNTELYFSVSSNPSNFGATVYNEIFKELEINAIYKPLKCNSKEEFPGLLRSLQTIGASGISVSMPFKRQASQLVEAGDFITSKIGNANTIDLKNNKCYNTDFHGFECASGLGEHSHTPSVVIVGGGAIAETIKASFNYKFIRTLKREHLYVLNEPLLFDGLQEKKYLINASPIGMDGVEDNIFTKNNTKGYDLIIDVVAKKDTNLKRCAEANNIKFVSGLEIAKFQLCKQFEIYTGKEIDPNWVHFIMKGKGLL